MKDGEKLTDYLSQVDDSYISDTIQHTNIKNSGYVEHGRTSNFNWRLFATVAACVVVGVGTWLSVLFGMNLVEKRSNNNTPAGNIAGEGNETQTYTETVTENNSETAAEMIDVPDGYKLIKNGIKVEYFDGKYDAEMLKNNPTSFSLDMYLTDCNTYEISSSNFHYTKPEDLKLIVDKVSLQTVRVNLLKMIELNAGEYDLFYVNYYDYETGELVYTDNNAVDYLKGNILDLPMNKATGERKYIVCFYLQALTFGLTDPTHNNFDYVNVYEYQAAFVVDFAAREGTVTTSEPEEETTYDWENVEYVYITKYSSTELPQTKLLNICDLSYEIIADIKSMEDDDEMLIEHYYYINPCEYEDRDIWVIEAGTFGQFILIDNMTEVAKIYGGFDSYGMGIGGKMTMPDNFAEHIEQAWTQAKSMAKTQ